MLPYCANYRLLFAGILVCGLSFAGTAQTSNIAKMQKAIKTYNSLSEHLDKLAAVTDKDLQFVEKQLQTGLPLCEAVIRDTTGEYQKIARYFKANFNQQKGHSIARSGKTAEGIRLYREIMPEYEAFTPAFFPLRYTMDDKSYVVHYEDFAPVYCEVLSGLAEEACTQKRYAEAIPYAQKVLDNGNAGNYIKTLSADYLLESKEQLGQLYSSDAPATITMMKAANSADAADRKAFEDAGYKPVLKAYNYLKSILAKNNLSDKSDLLRQAASYLAQNSHIEEAAEAYETILAAGAKDAYVLREIMDFATRNRRAPLGLKAAQELQSILNDTQCEEWASLGTRFKGFGDAAAAKTAQEKADNCRKEKNKQDKVANKSFQIYGGIYIWPLLTRFNKYRDYGGVLNIGNQHLMVELSYQQIRKNRELLKWRDYRGDDFGLHYWNGYYSHVAFKYGNKRSQKSAYSGFLLGYNHREIEPYTATVIDPAAQVTVQSFAPVHNQYILMINNGMMSRHGLFAGDFYFGFGLAYNTFTAGNSIWRQSGYTYNDTLLTNRKEKFVNVVLRMGFTVGLSTGRAKIPAPTPRF